MEIDKNLTYCLNIHPGETWSENFNAISNYVLKVKEAVSPAGSFPLGLRLSDAASKELRKKEALEGFKRFICEKDLFVPTINGFPFGRFHKTSVKTNVYRPDWRTNKRVDYTKRLGTILAELLPPDVRGSISTVPGSYRRWIGENGEEKRRKIRRMIENMVEVAIHLRRLHQSTGKMINLALEPEPDCFLESSDDVIRFFGTWLPEMGVPYLRNVTGVSVSEAEKIIRRHIGLCFDIAHFQVVFEDPAESLKRVVEAGVPVSKIQVSSALCLKPDKKSLKKLAAFSDPVYLHQVSAKLENGDLERFSDLPEALDATKDSVLEKYAEWRVHFHVPLFIENYDGMWSAAASMDQAFFDFQRRMKEPPLLEIETYTFDVLPTKLRPKSVVESIVKEFKWTRDRLSGDFPLKKEKS